MKTIFIAGGCFWGIQEYYSRLKGVVNTEVGYAQGSMKEPTYEEVCSQKTHHAETCKIEYDEDIITLTMLLDHMFRIIDPTSYHRQGGDIGSQYRTGVYYIDKAEKVVIQKFISEKQKEYQEKILVEVEELNVFYTAEDYHQKYLLKNPGGYCHVDFNKIKKEELKS